MTFKIERPGIYVADGRKAEVLAIRGSRAYGVDPDGDGDDWNVETGRANKSYNITGPWQNPVEFWVNRHENGLSANYSTRNIAINAASKSSRSVVATHRLRLIDGKLVDVTEEDHASD